MQTAAQNEFSDFRQTRFGRYTAATCWHRFLHAWEAIVEVWQGHLLGVLIHVPLALWTSVLASARGPTEKFAAIVSCRPRRVEAMGLARSVQKMLLSRIAA